MRLCLLALLALAPLGHPSAQARYVVAADPTASAEAGAQTLLSVRMALDEAQHRVLPDRFGSERSVGSKALGVVYRLGTYTLLESPLNRLALVAQHEVFGHGAVFRERGWENVSYRVDLPAPYGFGGGSARSALPATATIDAVGTASAAGSNANSVLADAIVEDALQSDRLVHTAAAAYVANALDPALYVLAGLGGQEGNPFDRNDASSLLGTLNARAAERGLGRVSVEDLQRGAAASALDPVLYVGLYGVVKEYLYSGREAVRIPMIRLGSVRYLPAVRYTYGPHGGEVMLDHRLVQVDRTARVRMRTSAGAVQTTWGLGARVTSLARVRGVDLDAGLDVWDQPSLQFDTREPVRGGGLGGAARVAAHVPLALDGRGAAFVEVGAKTFGFVGGDPMRGGPLVRVGLSLQTIARP